MARAIEKWSDEEFEELKGKPGRHSDGGNLYLDVRPDDAGAYWYLRFSHRGKPKQLHFGPLHGVTLRQARKQAAEARGKLARGIDPKAERDSERTATRLAKTREVTFSRAVDSFFAAKRGGWRSAKHANEWRQGLRIYIEPRLGELPVSAIDVASVLGVLEPLWHQRPDIAWRLRQRIEATLDYAKSREWRSGENPARWRGHLENLLPAVRTLAPIEHHVALPFGAIPSFAAQLRQAGGVVADLLEFILLTAVRTGEARKATWDEVTGNIWLIPASRTKRHREHRVALSSAALAVLDRRRQQSAPGYIFPGRGGPGTAMGTTMAHELMQKLRPGVTVHGLRSSFADWAGETTSFPTQWVEAALGHKVGSATETAYRRGDFLAPRQRLMNAWADYVAGQGTLADVIELDGRRAG